MKVYQTDKVEKELVSWYLAEMEKLERSGLGFVSRLIRRARLKFEFKQKLARHYADLYPDVRRRERELRRAYALYRGM
jgi:hypothetical protein